MKNLKKVLALGLALVMLLGMFTVASAAETKMVATNFTDWNAVQNKDAVSLMVDLGVIKGIEQTDGTFAYKPADTIDRASWAKMVYYIITNESDAKVYVPEGNVFPDVPNTHWAAGEIAYLKTLGIVAGDGTGYRPSDTITMVEAYKMMLTGIGYDAEYEEYVGNNWAGNVTKDASRLGLTDKISAGQSANLTRDVAARIVYNALDCNVKELDKKQIGSIGTMIDGYKTYGTLAYENFKIAKKILTVESVDEDGVATFTGSDAAKMTGVTASAADVGRSVQIWANVTKDASDNYQYNSAKSSYAFPADIEAVKTVTGGVASDKLNTIFTKGADDYAGLPADAHVACLMDGKPVTISNTTDSNSNITGISSSDTAFTAAIAKSGNVTEYFDDDEDGDIDLIKVTTWKPVQLGDIKTRTNSDGKLEVSVGGVTSGYVLASRVDGYQGLAKDDVVLVNDSVVGASYDIHFFTIEKLEGIDGKVTANSSDGKITVAGTKYEKSDIAPAGMDAFASWSDFDSEFAFYLGKDGKVCFAVVTEEGIDTSKVAMVLDTLFVIGGDIDVANNARMKLLFTDGTTENVTVTKVDGDKIVESSPGTDEVAIATVTATARKMFYNYKVDSNGKYELTSMTTGDKWAANKTEDITTAVANKPAFTTGFAADSKTLFIVEKVDKDDNSTFYTYAGYTNLPKMNAGAASIVTAATEKDASAAKYVFIKTTAYADDKPEGLVYLRDNGYTYSKADDCYEINVVDATGNATTLKVSGSVKFDGTAISSWGSTTLDGKVKTFYTIDSVTDGVVDALTTANASGSIKDVTNADGIAVANGVVTWGTNNSYEVTDSTVMVWIDLKDDDGTPVYGSCGTFTAGDLSTSADEYPSGVTAKVVLSDDVADFIYVVRDASPAAGA